MRSSIFLAVMAILARVAFAQQINTIAGNGQRGFSGDGGPALQASLRAPSVLATDAEGNVYIGASVDFCVRKITPAGVITTVAGNGQRGLPPIPGFSDDGKPATSVALGTVQGLATDSNGNLYIADGWAIRKVDRTGVFYTVVGGGSNYANGIPASQAATVGTFGLVVDAAGNIYYSETTTGLVRKVDAAGIVNTVAGTFGVLPGFSGDGGPATEAVLNVPRSLAVDGEGNLYIADSANRRIRKVTPQGMISTVIGSSGRGYSGDNGPAGEAKYEDAFGMVCDLTGNLYFTDTTNDRVRRVGTDGNITAVAGTGTRGFRGDGGPATAAQLNAPQGLAIDSAQNLYFGDANNYRIRKISAASGKQPQISPDGILNGASFVKQAAPGSLISIFGTDLASGTASAASLPFPKTLGGTSVNIGGVQAPLTYVSPTQINLQLPYEAPVGTRAAVVVTSNGVSSSAGDLLVVGEAPGIFTYGENRAVAQNQDYSLNETNRPAAAGSVLTVYMTGASHVTNMPATGAAAPSDPLATVISTVAATIGGQKADVLFAGLTPGFAGLLQVSVRVPTLPGGNHPLVVALNLSRSNSALVAVR